MNTPSEDSASDPNSSEEIMSGDGVFYLVVEEGLVHAAFSTWDRANEYVSALNGQLQIRTMQIDEIDVPKNHSAFLVTASDTLSYICAEQTNVVPSNRILHADGAESVLSTVVWAKDAGEAAKYLVTLIRRGL